MKRFISLAIVLFAATSLITSTFAGRGSEEPAPVPVVPIVTPIPQDPADTPDSNDPANDQDDNAQTPQQGFSNAQTAGIAVGAAAGALAAVGAGVLAKKQYSKAKNLEIAVIHKEIDKMGQGESFSNDHYESMAMIESAKKMAEHPAESKEYKIHEKILTNLETNASSNAHNKLAKDLKIKVENFKSGQEIAIGKPRRAASFLAPERMANKTVRERETRII